MIPCNTSTTEKVNCRWLQRQHFPVIKTTRPLQRTSNRCAGVHCTNLQFSEVTALKYTLNHIMCVTPLHSGETWNGYAGIYRHESPALDSIVTLSVFWRAMKLCVVQGAARMESSQWWWWMDGCEEEWAPEVNGVKGRLQKCAQTVTTDSSREENTIGLRRWRRNLIGWTERVNEVIVEEAGEKRILFNPTTHLHPLWTVLFFILRQLSWFFAANQDNKLKHMARKKAAPVVDRCLRFILMRMKRGNGWMVKSSWMLNWTFSTIYLVNRTRRLVISWL